MEKLQLWKEKIEGRLRELLGRVQEPEPLASAMKYYVFQKGKRIRPLFLTAVAETLGGDVEDAVTVGCAVEMIHNYSLIHDDLPAMDNDDFRRGQPSCHRKFGEAVAVLAGDALLTYAFEVLSDPSLYRSISPENLLRVARIIAVKSGIEGMVGGQALDITEEEDLEKVNLRKTAALFEACFLCGGVVAGKEELLSSLEKTGRRVGLLFQITDDILDRDGYWKRLGAKSALRKAGNIYAELAEDVGDLFGKTSEIMYLVDLIWNRVREDAPP